MKPGFLLYKDTYETIKLLSVDEKAELLDAMFDYSIKQETKPLSKSIELVFSFIKRQLDRDTEKYHNICERNHINGLKGGRPKKNPDNPVGFLETQDNPKKPIKDKGQRIKDKELLNTATIVAELPVEWQSIFNIWLNYKKDRKQAYKSKDSILIAYKHLVELSNNSPTEAEKIIQQSIANNWAGLFKPKNNYQQESKAERSVQNARKYIEAINI